VAAFARYVARRLRANATYRIAVGHADAEAEGRRLLEALQAAVPAIESAYLTPLGAALGVHGGPGMLVVGAQEYAPPG
jgi:fatty acid-binding protein DegV